MKLEKVSDYKKVSPRNKLEVLDNVLQGIKDNLAIYQIPKSAYDALALIPIGLLEVVERWENPHTNTSEVQKELREYEKVTDQVVVNWFVHYIMTNEYVSPAARVGMRLPVEMRRKPVPTPVPDQKVYAEVTLKTSGWVEFRLFHTPQNKRAGKPAGTSGCEFCYGPGENLRPEECLFHEIVTKSIFVKVFGSEAYDKPHIARFRWFNSEGESGIMEHCLPLYAAAGDVRMPHPHTGRGEDYKKKSVWTVWFGRF
ncbi:hypothetical protein Barb4_00894 [Bacteroidales bacterium Barb4]|nr:hypothetical protein Barb4_00894 [Bacteroidales bacterium Barb4]